jgi:hypothetical protein
MKPLLVLLASCGLLLPAALAANQKSDRKKEKTKESDQPAVAFAEALPHGIQFGSRQTQRWKVGLVITAPNGACGGIFGTIPVPTNWPEQQVKIVAEELSSQVQAVDYRTLDNGVKQMLVSIPQLAANETAQALVTFEVTKCTVLAPADPSQFLLPLKTQRKMAPFLAASPFIESTHSKIRGLAKEIVKDRAQEDAWKQVEAIYDYVRDHVEYKDGPLKGALAALKDGTGDCEELTSLFIALCRANRIPARTVWVHGHCYPEFYLEDKEGNGHWIPCQAAGTRDFGSMPDTRPILQKGDNYRVPEEKKPQRYVAEFLSVKSVRGAGEPKVRFVRELLPAG